jgi:hypothetical protein
MTFGTRLRSMLIHEGRHSIVEIAAQLGHNPTTCLSTYAHVIAELREAPQVPAEQQIRLAGAGGRDTARTPPSRQLSLGDLGLSRQAGGPHGLDAAETRPTGAYPDGGQPAAADTETKNGPHLRGFARRALFRTRTGDPFLTIGSGW